MSEMNTINKRKQRDISELLIGLILLISLNIVGQYIFSRFDLTSDKRYTISEATKEKLKGLEDVVFVRIYLDGDLPAGFKRLKNSTREMLEEFRVYANDNIQYEFIDPSAEPDQKVRNDIYRELSKKGLNYTNLKTKDGDKVSEQIVFPGLIMSYREREVPLQLLKSQIGADPEVMLNNSIQQLEYELISTIKKVSENYKKRLAFIEGHGELKELEVADISQALSEFYAVERIKIDGKLDALDYLDAIIIAGPDSQYTEKDKYMIDQFIMKGGKVLWLVESVFADQDSLRKNTITLGLPKSVNLEDQLFKYGVRINTDFILDLRALPIPIITGMIGNQPKQEFFPWYYYPLLMSENKHPIVNNIEAVMSNFVSSIDTVGSNANIRKTPLLQTSQYTKLVLAPHRISFNILREAPDERSYTKSFQNVAILLEGEFESVFKNRLNPEVTQNPDFKYRDLSKETKMIVISDADIIRNKVNWDKKEFYALGYDRFTQRTYGNKEFIMNCMHYLLDDDGLINARSKEFRIRLLDKQRIEKEKKKWQILNTAFPIALVLLFGSLLAWIRKRKYAK